MTLSVALALGLVGCQSAGDADCAPESDAAFCARYGKSCANFKNTDNCGASRSVNCGTCSAPDSCAGGGSENVCGHVSSCVPQSDASLCAQNKKNCGTYQQMDNCAALRAVGCGTCAAPKTCGGAGLANVCGLKTCVPESDASLCARYGKSCDPIEQLDNCGALRSVDCGACTAPDTCGGAGSPGICGQTAIDPEGPTCGWPFNQPTVQPSQVDAVIIGSVDGNPPHDRFRVRVGWPGFNPVTPIAWDVSGFTGFNPGAHGAHQRGHKDEYPDSAVQVSESVSTLGLWLNSLEEEPSFASQPDVSINAGCWYWVEAPQAFPSGAGKLHVRFDLQVPYASNVGPSNAGMVGFNFMFSEWVNAAPTGRTFWYSITVFDLRPSMASWQAVQPDTSGTTTSAIVGSSIDVPGWFTKAGTSAGFRSAQFTGPAAYELTISPAEFIAAVLTLRSYGNGYEGLSDDPSNYRLFHFNIGPEFHDVDSAGWVQLGVAVSNLAVEYLP